MLENSTIFCSNKPRVGVWLSLVERCVRDAEAGGSNPLTPTKANRCARLLRCTYKTQIRFHHVSAIQPIVMGYV